MTSQEAWAKIRQNDYVTYKSKFSHFPRIGIVQSMGRDSMGVWSNHPAFVSSYWNEMYESVSDLQVISKTQYDCLVRLLYSNDRS